MNWIKTRNKMTLKYLKKCCWSQQKIFKMLELQQNEQSKIDEPTSTNRCVK